MSKCDTCINKKYCANHLDARTMCPQMDYVLFTPSYKTNYDLIISKTPEELAVWMNGIIKERYIEVTCDGWLSWLKAPAEKEVGE